LKKFISALLAIIGIILLVNFVSSLDFSRTNLPGFIWSGNNVQKPATPINASLTNANLANLSANSNPPRVPIYFVEGLNENISLMRTAVYNIYYNGVWLEDVKYSDLPTPSFGNLVYKVTPITEFKDHVPVVKNTAFITVKSRYNSSAGVFKVERCSSQYYGFARVEEIKPSELANDGFSKIYMSEDELKAIRELALKVTANAKNDYEKVLAIERFLKKNYVYDFNYSIEGDPVYWFLFKVKRGICKHFASAFVVMCNSIGIPARVVVGYKVKPTPANQTVFADQAHMWAEVKFKEGWVEFDPTPAGFERKIPTTTSITYVDDKIVAGQNFTVKGVVSYGNGLVENGFVEIYLKKTKQEEGILVGLIYFENGRFNATLKAPNVTGKYHVVAHFVGSFKYSDSWSDPVVEIYEKPKLVVDLPEKITHNFIVRGKIVIRDLPVELKVFVDGKLYKVVETDENGYFEFNLSLSRGYHKIAVVYDGSEFVLPAKYEKTVEVGELEVRLSNYTVLAGVDNSVAFYVYFNDKPVEVFEVNGIPTKFGENVTIKPDKIGKISVNISAYGFKKVIYLKSIAEVRIDYEFDGNLKVYVVDILGNKLNGTIYADGKPYRIENGLAVIPVNHTVELYYPGDEYHLPAKIVAKPKPSPLLYLIPVAVVLAGFAGFKAYNRYRYGVDVEFAKELPDLPLIWCVGEKIKFVVRCRSKYVIKTDGRVVDNEVVFDKAGKHVFEVLVMDGKGKVRNVKKYEITVVSDYGEAISLVFKTLENTLGVSKSFTAREVVRVAKCRLEKTLTSLEKYVYGNRRNYSRQDFVTAFEEVKSCLRGLQLQA
jgi:transglutaminase-like putative cysteine protease